MTQQDYNLEALRLAIYSFNSHSITPTGSANLNRHVDEDVLVRAERLVNFINTGHAYGDPV